MAVTTFAPDADPNFVLSEIQRITFDPDFVLSEIQSIVIEYLQLSADSLDIDSLMNGRRQLACQISFWAQHVGELYKQKNHMELRRKAKIATVVDEKRRNEGAKVTEAGRAAELAAVGELKAELDADAEYKAANLLLESWGNVLDVMGQHISNLKLEKSKILNGTGSQ